MLLLLSPSKNMRLQPLNGRLTKPSYAFPDRTLRLIRVLQGYSVAELEQLMGINPKLALQTFERFRNWAMDGHETEQHKALLAYTGEVYNGLKAHTLSAVQWDYAQKHLRILSGLYGVLRPFDPVQPYRLEMGIRMSVGKSTNLYNFWANRISDRLKADLDASGSRVLINLASNEYTKVGRLKRLGARVITPVFKELKGDRYQMVTMYAKKARGMMTRFIIEHNLTEPGPMKLFDNEGYFYNEPLSTESEWVFTR